MGKDKMGLKTRDIRRIMGITQEVIRSTRYCLIAIWRSAIRLKYQRRGMGNAPIVGLWECGNRRTFAPSKRQIND